MFKTKEEVKSILVVRSAPLPRTFEALKKVREEYPNAEISVLVQEEVKDEIEKVGFVNKVIVGIKRGRIDLIRHLPLVLRLRRETFDLVAIIYNTEDISWYGNLRRFACAIKAKKRVGITTENTFQPFSVVGVVGEVIFKGLILRMILKPLMLIIIGSLLIVLLGVSLSLFYLKNVFISFKKRFLVITQ